MTKLGVLKYSVMYDNGRIDPNESITLRVYYHQDRVIGNPFSATLTIGLSDENNFYWHQPLFTSPKNKIYVKVRKSHTQSI